MRVLFSTCSATHYMAPPRLSDEQVNCGPFLPDREIGGRVLSLATAKGEYDLGAVAARLPDEQKPDVVVCLVDASWFNVPRNLAAFSCPKVLLIADTHHMHQPITTMFAYARSQPFDRHVFLYSRHHLEFFRHAGFKNLFWLPALTFPHDDTTVRRARAETREPCIALIGQAGNLHARRLELAGALAARDLPLHFREASQREALGLYGRSLIGFNASANADLNLRVFEVMASGALLLTDRLSAESGAGQLWTEGRELVTYRDAAELTERAAHYLAHPDEARAIGAAGARWFDEHFTEAHRRAAFRDLAFDGREAPAFALPRPTAPFFRGPAERFAAATIAYEQVQLWHSRQESVRVLTDAGVPGDFARLCATLPRVTVEPATPGAEGDLFVTSVAVATKLANLPAPRLWCWDATTAQVPALTARFAASGLAQPRKGIALFGLPAAEAESCTEPRVLEARRALLSADLAKALELARTLLKEQPQCGDAYVVMAELALEAGNTDLFAKMIARALQLVPAEPRLHLLRLAARQPASRQTAAERLLSVALRHLSGADHANATHIARRAQKLDPRLAAAHHWVGRLALLEAAALRDFAHWRATGHGLRALRQSAALAPTRPEYRFELGLALRQAGLFAEAAASFVQTLELDPENAIALFCLGEAHFRAGDYDRAAEAFAQGLALAPADRHLLRWLGHARKRQGRPAEAYALYHRAADPAAAPPALAGPRGRRRVLFLVQHGPSWSCTESVHAAFAADPKWEATIVALPYAHPFYNGAQDDANEIFGFLEQRRIPHVRWDNFRLAPGCADVIFVQNPYDVTRPEGWRVPDLLRHGARLAYVPYGLEIVGGERANGLVMDMPLQQLAWMVFARSERQKRAYAEHCLSGAAHVVVTGHTKFDALREQLPRADTTALTRFAAGRTLIAWNPHFDIQLNGTRFGAGISTFLRWHEFLLEEFARRPGLALVLRPHPLFVATLEERGVMAQGQIQAYFERCTASGRVFIDREASCLPLFAAAAAMLSDASSFVFEFAATGKPLLYLHNPHGPPLNSDGDFVHRHLYTAERESEIRDFLDLVEAGRDPRAEARRAAFPDYIHQPPGGVGLAVKRAVDAQLACEGVLPGAESERIAV